MSLDLGWAYRLGEWVAWVAGSSAVSGSAVSGSAVSGGSINNNIVGCFQGININTGGNLFTDLIGDICMFPYGSAIPVKIGTNHSHVSDGAFPIQEPSIQWGPPTAILRTINVQNHHPVYDPFNSRWREAAEQCKKLKSKAIREPSLIEVWSD